MENTENKLKMLAQIQKVEPGPFLLTQIKQKIENASDVYYSKKLVWSTGVSLLVLLFFNVLVIASKQHKSSDADLLQEFNLVQNNTLYK